MPLLRQVACGEGGQMTIRNFLIGRNSNLIDLIIASLAGVCYGKENYILGLAVIFIGSAISVIAETMMKKVSDG